jgi:signal transduction histidine kinase
VTAPPTDGTALAPEGRVAPSSRYQAIRAVHFRATATEWLRWRPWRMAPSLLVSTSLFLASGFPRARVAAVVTMNTMLLAYQFFHAHQAQRGRVDERTIFASHLVIMSGQAVVMALTGGMASPLWPGLLGATLGTLHVFGNSRESSITVAYAGALTLVVTLLPQAALGPPIPRPYNVMLAAWALLFTLYLMRKSSFALSDAHRRTGETLDKMREDVLDAAAARTQGLECVGAKVAHELKNPLSAVKGLAQLLSRGAADDRSRERLAVIESEVSRMEGILRDYLSFSRPLEDLRTRPVDLVVIADDVLAVLEARAEVAGVTLKRSGEGVGAVGDPRRLKEALLNLVANALEATPRGGSVEVALAAGGDEASIAVRDTGKGIAPEDLARVGTPFFTKREGGTGLGVVLARGVLRQHGGDLRFESELGRGTTVTLRLPARASAPPVAITPGAPECPKAAARAAGAKETAVDG